MNYIFCYTYVFIEVLYKFSSFSTFFSIYLLSKSKDRVFKNFTYFINIFIYSTNTYWDTHYVSGTILDATVFLIFFFIVIPTVRVWMLVRCSIPQPTLGLQKVSFILIPRTTVRAWVKAYLQRASMGYVVICC